MNHQKIGVVVFFINGEMHELNGVKEISQFLLEKALPKFVFDIHPQWDMRYFGPIIQQQLELGPPHRVLPETKQAYDKWATNLNVHEPSVQDSKLSQEDDISVSRGIIITPKFKDSYTEIKENIAVVDQNKSNDISINQNSEQDNTPKLQ